MKIVFLIFLATLYDHLFIAPIPTYSCYDSILEDDSFYTLVNTKIINTF